MPDAHAHLPGPSLHPVADVPAGVTEAPAHDATRKPKDKVRSAWISFAGRIVAQLIGAAATVLLGVYVANAYARHVAAPPAASPPNVAADAGQGAGDVAPVVRTRQGQGLSLVVLPFQDYTPAAASGYLADGLTEAVTATLARGGQVRVISRTSAMHFREARGPLPAIAAALGVDLVIEGSVSRQGRRLRVTVQLIDARSDEHLWAQTYDRTTRDVLAVEADVAMAIARELTAVLPRSRHGETLDATASTTPSREPGWLVASQEPRP